MGKSLGNSRKVGSRFRLTWHRPRGGFHIETARARDAHLCDLISIAPQTRAKANGTLPGLRCRGSYGLRVAGYQGW